MTPDVWRVVDTRGVVRAVLVYPRRPDWIADVDGPGYRAGLGADDEWGTTPRLACLRLAEALGIEVAEILAPGDLTRAEAIGAEVAAAVAGERETCARLCEDRAAHLDAGQGEEEPDDANDEEMEGYGRFLEALHLAEAIRGRALTAPAPTTGGV